MFFEGIKHALDQSKLRPQRVIKNNHDLQRLSNKTDMNIQVQQPGARDKKEIKLIPPAGQNKGIRIIRKQPSSSAHMNIASSDSEADSEVGQRVEDPFKQPTLKKKRRDRDNFQGDGISEFINQNKRISGEPPNEYPGANAQVEDDSSSASGSTIGEGYSGSESSSNVSSIASEMEFSNDKLLRKQKKYELLSKLQGLQRRGVVLSRNYSIKSKLHDLQFEFDRVSESMNKEAGLKFARKVLMATITGIEFANKKFDPVQAKLEGWSESVMENIEDYDNALVRLVDKYGKSVEVAPEIELLTALIGSAFMFHLSKTILQNPVGILSSLGEQNPDMLASVMKNVMSNIRPGEEHGPKGSTPKGPPQDMTAPSLNINDLMSKMGAGGGDDSSSEDDDGSSYTDASDSDEDIRLVTVPEEKTKRGRPRRRI